MRRLLLRNIPDDIQKAIRMKARTDHIRNEEAVIELIRELQIERDVQHDLAILESEWDENEEQDSPGPCHGHCRCACNVEHPAGEPV